MGKKHGSETNTKMLQRKMYNSPYDYQEKSRHQGIGITSHAEPIAEGTSELQMEDPEYLHYNSPKSSSKPYEIDFKAAADRSSELYSRRRKKKRSMEQELIIAKRREILAETKFKYYQERMQSLGSVPQRLEQLKELDDQLNEERAKKQGI